jgi:Ca2+-binding EF-hand superfamily protein
MKSTVIVLALMAAPLAVLADDTEPGRGYMGGYQMGGKNLIQTLDTNKDGKVSRDESSKAAVERANRRFDQLDADKDGFITQAEIDTARNKMRSEMRSEMSRRGAENWKAADKDADGAISRSEAEAGMPMLFRRFDQLDANKDGKISRDEMPQGKRMDDGSKGPPTT